MPRLSDVDAFCSPRGFLVGVEHDDPGKTDLALSQGLSVLPTAAAVTGTTVETTLRTITLPGGLIGAGAIRLHTAWSATNNANAKTCRVKLGATVLGSGSASSVAGIRFSTILFVRPTAELVHHVGAANMADQSGSGAAWAVVPFDPAIDQVLTITGQLATAGDTLTLEGVLAEVVPWWAPW